MAGSSHPLQPTARTRGDPAERSRTRSVPHVRPACPLPREHCDAARRRGGTHCAADDGVAV